MTRKLTAVLGAGVVGLAVCTAAFAQTETSANGKIPELASAEFAWLVLGVNWADPPPGLGRGPIRQDPAHPFHGNRDGAK
jgi:hypothetical protein